jgi:hypothetical protein
MQEREGGDIGREGEGGKERSNKSKREVESDMEREGGGV